MLLCAAAALSLLLASAAASCPDGSLVAGSSCFMLSPEAMDWYQAQQVGDIWIVQFANILFKFCWSKDGYLAELKTVEEDNSISPYLPRGLRYWIGLTYVAQEG